MVTEGILSLIDNAIEDYGEGPDAMRWRPEAPEEGRSASTGYITPELRFLAAGWRYESVRCVDCERVRVRAHQATGGDQVG